MAKLPYIPDKKLYAAVMGALSWIHSGGYFNRACRYYAKKYEVSEEDVDKYVSIGLSDDHNSDKKFYYFAVEFSVMDAIDPYFSKKHAQYEVRRAISAANARHAISKEYNKMGDSNYSCQDAYFGRTERFDTKGEAWRCVHEWEKQAHPTKENQSGQGGYHV